MKTIKQSYKINAPIEKVWKALVDPKEIDGWGGGPAKMDDKKGTKFSLWGGSIWGTNKDVIPEKKLVQDWYSNEDGEWKKPSLATFTLESDGKSTIVSLLHEDVPDEYASNIREGWKEYYLGPLKEYLEKEV